MRHSVDEAAAAVLEFVERERGARPGYRSRQLDTPYGDRLVAELTLDGPAGDPGEALIVKRYRDETGAATFRVMAMLVATIARAGAAVLAVPEPVAYDRARRCLVQRRARGTCLRSLEGQRATLAALRSVGQALAELHGLPLLVGDPKDAGQHIDELIHPHPRALAQRLPAHGSRIESLVSAIEAKAAACREAFLPRPVHRDLHPGQLFVDGSRVSVIDWDLYAKGDPALDVGNFLVCLETRYPALHPAARDAFLAGYLGRASWEIEDRIPLYAALACLRRASKHFRLRAPDWPVGTDAMLGHAERWLGSPR